MKVWITKYALTDGIFEADVRYPVGGMIAVEDRGPAQFFHTPDWHVNREDAVARAEKVRLRKIANLEKQLAKLRAKVFA